MIKKIFSFILASAIMILAPLLIIYIGYYIHYIFECFLDGKFYPPRIPFINSIHGNISFDKRLIIGGVIFFVIVLIMGGGDDSFDDDPN